MNSASEQRNSIASAGSGEPVGSAFAPRELVGLPAAIRTVGSISRMPGGTTIFPGHHANLQMSRARAWGCDPCPRNEPGGSRLQGFRISRSRSRRPSDVLRSWRSALAVVPARARARRQCLRSRSCRRRGSHAVEDLANPDEVDAPAVSQGREVPVLEAAAVVLEVNVSNQVLDLLELVARVETPVVVGDVAGVEVEPDARDDRRRSSGRAWRRRSGWALCASRGPG